MLHKDDRVVGVLEDGHSTLNQVWDETSNLVILLSPRYEDSQHIGHNVEENWRHRISLPQSLLGLEIMFFVHKYEIKIYAYSPYCHFLIDKKKPYCHLLLDINLCTPE